MFGLYSEEPTEEALLELDEFSEEFEPLFELSELLLLVVLLPPELLSELFPEFVFEFELLFDKFSWEFDKLWFE